MDYPQTNPQMNPQMNPYQTPEPSRSSWKWVVVILILVAIAVGWYLYREFLAPQAVPYNSTAQQTPPPPTENTNAAGDTTSDISKDLNQLPDDSAAANELNSLDQNLQNF